MSYTSLQNDVKTLSHRADLDAQIPLFIDFAENELNRMLRHREMETAIAETDLVDGKYSLPDDFLSLKWVENITTGCALKVLEGRGVENKQNNAGQAAYYAIDNNTLKCWPSSGTIEGVYYAKIPNLQENETNWLDDSHHDLYVYLTLKHLHAHINNMSKAQVYDAYADKILQQVQSESSASVISGAPLTQRAR